MLHRIFHLLFPPKCVFCRCLLSREETDLCHSCRSAAPVAGKPKNTYSFVARWTAVWYYKEDARQSILRYKFYRRRQYAQFFGRALAMHLQQTGMDRFDVLTWVPISRVRKWRRGYDQTALLAKAVARELGCAPVRCLKKKKNNPPQSGLKDAARRRANVLNMYRVPRPELVRGKRILLLDDIITTGATLSECAKTLLLAGAEEVTGAALAASPGENEKM